MRIASIAKALNGAVVLHLVQQKRLQLDDTIGRRSKRTMPAAWSRLTVRELLNHTSGLPDYTRSDGFRRQARTDPHGYVAPTQIMDWVRSDGMALTPGSRYGYSNTDNIVLGFDCPTRDRNVVWPDAVQRRVRSRGAAPDELPDSDDRGAGALHPWLRGRAGHVCSRHHDAPEPSGAWASGAIVSTPADLGTFIRADLGGRFFGAAQRRQQMQFVAGSSSPAGPGVNSAGRAVLRYRTPCGTVYGHTGHFPGYVQWAAATANGRRSVTSALNIAAPTGALLDWLRSVQAAAVCVLLGR